MKDFKLNQKIELVAEDGKITSGTIHDIKGEKIYISVTARDLSNKILRVGDSIDAILYCEDKLLAFNGTISARLMEDLPLYEVSEIINLTKAQRRKDVRVPCSISMGYSYNKYLLNMDINRGDTRTIVEEMSKYLSEGIILDLSAGGARIYINEDLKMDKEIMLVFTLKEEIIVKATIVYKDINMLPNKTTYFYGIRFDNMDERKREQIISYVFLLMRKNRIK